MGCRTSCFRHEEQRQASQSNVPHTQPATSPTLSDRLFQRVLTMHSLHAKHTSEKNQAATPVFADGISRSVSLPPPPTSWKQKAATHDHTHTLSHGTTCPHIVCRTPKKRVSRDVPPPPPRPVHQRTQKLRLERTMAHLTHHVPESSLPVSKSVHKLMQRSGSEPCLALPRIDHADESPALFWESKYPFDSEATLSNMPPPPPSITSSVSTIPPPPSVTSSVSTIPPPPERTWTGNDISPVPPPPVISTRSLFSIPPAPHSTRSLGAASEILVTFDRSFDRSFGGESDFDGRHSASWFAPDSPRDTDMLYPLPSEPHFSYPSPHANPTRNSLFCPSPTLCSGRSLISNTSSIPLPPPLTLSERSITSSTSSSVPPPPPPLMTHCSVMSTTSSIPPPPLSTGATVVPPPPSTASEENKSQEGAVSMPVNASTDEVNQAREHAILAEWNDERKRILRHKLRFISTFYS